MAAQNSPLYPKNYRFEGTCRTMIFIGDELFRVDTFAANGVYALEEALDNVEGEAALACCIPAVTKAGYRPQTAQQIIDTLASYDIDCSSEIAREICKILEDPCSYVDDFHAGRGA